MSIAINPKLTGYLIFCFRDLRDVQLIELRNGFQKKYDLVIDFYLDRMDNSIYSRNIDLKRFERIRKISKAYSEYEIHYTLEKPEEENPFFKEKKYQYILVSQVENIVSSYHRTKQDFLEKSNSGNFCKKKDISELIDIYREHFKVLEQGSFVV